MTHKKSGLDPATVNLVKRVLAMPPKPHDEIKVGRPERKKKRGPKARAASAKPRSA
jgi:hypothetical protein